jgi:hypothetical protein
MMKVLLRSGLLSMKSSSLQVAMQNAHSAGQIQEGILRVNSLMKVLLHSALLSMKSSSLQVAMQQQQQQSFSAYTWQGRFREMQHSNIAETGRSGNSQQS